MRPIGLLLAVFLLALPARADDAADAREHFKKGQTHYSLGEFQDAVQEFREAYRIRHEPAILFNIGQAMRQIRQFQQAYFYYQQYLAQRADAMATDPMRAGVPAWDADRAAMLVASAATGLPLTGEEARLVQAQFTAAAGHYRAWPYWDLWSASIPDGTYPYAPAHGNADGEHPEIEELTLFLEYCRSPWRNPATVELVDCAAVNDPSRWGR